MIAKPVRDLPAAPASDDASVSAYLTKHPDFFERHEQLLASLQLPHARSGAAISLVERQVEVLREKHQAVERRLADLIAVARANDSLADRIHKLNRRLLRTSTRSTAVTEMEASLREDFGALQAVLVLTGARGAGLEQRFVRALPEGDAKLAGFESLFASGKPRCGQVRDSQRDFLFGDNAVDVGSVALIPLGGKTPFGLLALASNDRERFHPGMSTEFLARMGELVGDALSRT